MQKETGRLAWLLWRSAYFTMTLSWRNKWAMYKFALRSWTNDIAVQQNPCSYVLVLEL